MPKHDKLTDPVIREQFQQAHSAMMHGKHTDAVHALSDVFLAMLKAKPEIIEAKAMPGEEIATHGGWIEAFSAAIKWPQIGANLVPESVQEGKPRIDYTSDLFSLSEAVTYYEFAVATAIKYGV